MSLSIQLVDSVKTVEKNINKAISDLANDIIARNINRVTASVKSLIPPWISAQPEIQSLLSSSPDSLAGQFGIPGATSSIISSIINSIVGATEVKFVPYSANLKGGLELRFQPKNFSNLLALPDGHTVYRGGDLHWLDWLLKRGDSIIVTNYQYNPQTGLGRSGLGNMVTGNAFRVPPQFSGTVDNNFITRAFVGPQQETQISDIFKRLLQ